LTRRALKTAPGGADGEAWRLGGAGPPMLTERQVVASYRGEPKARGGRRWGAPPHS